MAGFLVAGEHLQVARGQLADAVPDAYVEAAGCGQRGGGVLGADQGGGVEGLDVLVGEGLGERGGLAAAEVGQLGAGYGRVEAEGHVGRGLAVADEDQAHAGVLR